MRAEAAPSGPIDTSATNAVRRELQAGEHPDAGAFVEAVVHPNQPCVASSTSPMRQSVGAD
jgi:hypothetical protein